MPGIQIPVPGREGTEQRDNLAAYTETHDFLESSLGIPRNVLYFGIWLIYAFPVSKETELIKETALIKGTG